ncbi:MAG: hypothetical protein QOH65_841 [Methylobacteriaceae bacterium]|nr:hypothetical protein [Methylobacteriaceae bacterium]
MLRRFRGSLDEGNRQFVRGWAASGRRPLDVTISFRGTPVTVSPSEERPDLVQLGLPLRSGFMFIFPEPLKDGDRVEVFFPNGKPIQNSPFVYAEHALAAVTGSGETSGFSDKYPTHQNSIDIFADVWASAMPTGSGLETGAGLLHFEDPRIPWAVSVLGALNGKSILELGPFEAYNTYQLEQLGAKVLSIEGNLVNFLKCLVLKNALSMSATFLFGDFVQYMERTEDRFDICWASGVLYHARDPVRLLTGACRVAPIIFVWTHYFDEAIISRSPEQLRFFRSNLDRQVKVGGREITLHYRSYVQKKGRLYSGGPDEYSYWLSKDDILAVLASQGFVHVANGLDEPQLARGPGFSFIASRAPIVHAPG